MGIASACAQLRFLNLDGCLVPGSCVVRVLAARQGIRFCHQLASLADEAEESPMWRDQQARCSRCWCLQPGRTQNRCVGARGACCAFGRQLAC